ncbi:MAG: SlyX family protein [Parvibaculaceae bacterium]|nr:SlyX family protein [Parvibaculaceae bacterium]
MSGEKTPGERIDALEMHLAHQDQIVEELNKTIAMQWRQIDELTRKLTQLGKHVLELEDKAGAMPPVDRPPPHY